MSEIEWRSYIDFDGPSILTIQEPPTEVPSSQELKVGEQYFIPTLFGYVIGSIDFHNGNPVATTEGSIYWLKKSHDTWRSWGGGNLKAIQRLELK